MSLAKQTLSGIAWTSVGRVVAQIASFVVTLFLARLLEPSDFGLVGMAAVISGFLSLIGELGLGAALVQRAELDERHRSTAFWLSVGSGVVLGGLLMLLAAQIAAFYHEPRLTPVIRVVALDFVIAPLRSVQSALLSRNMAFKRLALAEISGVVVSSTVAVVLAARGFGVWALVIRSLCGSVTHTLALWIASRWRPSFALDRLALRELWKFSSPLLGFTVLNYWARKADDLMIGKWLGSGPLGLYTRAYGTMMLPLTEITGVFGRVMFPLLSRLQEDKPRAKAIYLRTISAVSLVTFPLMLVLGVASEPLVRVLYGQKWVGMILVLQIYCVVGAYQSIATTVGWIYQSQGRTDWMLRWGLFASPLIIGALALGVYLGSIEKVAIAYAVVNLGVLGFPLFAVPGRLIDMSVGDVLRAVRGSTGCALVGAGTSFVIGHFSRPFVPLPVLLVLELVAGLGAALLSAHVANVAAYRDVRLLLATRSAARVAEGIAGS